MRESKINLVINKLSKAKYEELLRLDEINDNELYYIIDDDGETLVKGYAQEVLDKTLLDYVRKDELRGELDDILPVEANPQVASQDELDQLDNIKIGNVIYKVNEAGDTMSLSTESAVQPQPLLMRSLRSAPPQSDVYRLKTMKIAGDTWSVEPDLSDYSTTNEILTEIQTNKEETEENLNYKIDELKELLGQSLNANFDLEGYYLDSGTDEDKIIAAYYRDPDYGNQADILYYYTYIDEAPQEAAILFTYI